MYIGSKNTKVKPKKLFVYLRLKIINCKFGLQSITFEIVNEKLQLASEF